MSGNVTYYVGARPEGDTRMMRHDAVTEERLARAVEYVADVCHAPEDIARQAVLGVLSRLAGREETR